MRTFTAAVGVLLLLAGCSSSGGDDDSAFCARYREVLAADVIGPTEVLGADPAQIRATIDDGIAAAERAREVAPDEVAADIDVQIDVVVGFRDVLEPFDFDLVRFIDEADPSVIADLEERLSGPRVRASAERIDVYLAENCEIPAEQPPSSEQVADEIDPEKLAALIGNTITDEQLEILLQRLSFGSVDELVDAIVSGQLDIEDLEAIADSDPQNPFRYGDDEVLDGLYDECDDGVLGSCDRLRLDAPAGSQYAEFGERCGRRLDDDATASCEALFG